MPPHWQAPAVMTIQIFIFDVFLHLFCLLSFYARSLKYDVWGVSKLEILIFMFQVSQKDFGVVPPIFEADSAAYQSCVGKFIDH